MVVERRLDARQAEKRWPSAHLLRYHAPLCLGAYGKYYERATPFPTWRAPSARGILPNERHGLTRITQKERIWHAYHHCLLQTTFPLTSISTTGSVACLVRESDVAPNSLQCQPGSDGKVLATLGVFSLPAEENLQHAGTSRL